MYLTPTPATGAPEAAAKTPENLLAQFVAFAEAVALGQEGKISYTYTTSQTIDFLGKSLVVTEETTEKVTAKPA